MHLYSVLNVFNVYLVVVLNVFNYRNEPDGESTMLLYFTFSITFSFSM